MFASGFAPNLDIEFDYGRVCPQYHDAQSRDEAQQSSKNDSDVHSHTDHNGDSHHYKDGAELG